MRLAEKYLKQITPGEYVNHLLKFARLSLFTLGFSLPLAALAEPAETAAVKPTKTVEKLPLEELRKFTKAYEHIRKSYVEEIDDKTLLEYAIRGMLTELDPHSTYLNADSFQDLQEHTKGEFGGLGIEVGMENGFVKVISPIDDTPAAKAGVEAGDLIIRLDEKPVKGMSLNQAVEAMRGPKGSKIRITIVRGDDPAFDIEITRDLIKVDSLRSRLIDEQYGYIRIAQFQLRTGQDTREAVEGLLEDNPELKGLVIDLRNNPGGVLQASVEVADHFLEEGLIVYTEGRIERAHLSYSASEGDISNGLPIVILINGGSASASEIVAGALQDHRRAIVIGTQSFGKGSVQTVVPLNEEEAIKMTTALYYTPKGRSIQAQGISPDIEVVRAEVKTLDQRRAPSEADLQGHLGNGNGGPESGSGDRHNNTALFERDNQLFEAVNLLKGISLLNTATNDSEAEAAATDDETAN